MQCVSPRINKISSFEKKHQILCKQKPFIISPYLILLYSIGKLCIFLNLFFSLIEFAPKFMKFSNAFYTCILPTPSFAYQLMRVKIASLGLALTWLRVNVTALHWHKPWSSPTRTRPTDEASPDFLTQAKTCQQVRNMLPRSCLGHDDS